MNAITDVAQPAEEVYEAGALQGRPADELDARVDAVARPLIEQLGRLIQEANKTKEYNPKQRRDTQLKPEVITQRKTEALTYYTAHADELSGRLTPEQCTFLLRIALETNNFVPMCSLLSKQSTIDDREVGNYASKLPPAEFNVFLTDLEIPRFFTLFPEFTKRQAQKPALLERSLQILTLNDHRYNQAAYEKAFTLSLETGKFDQAISLIVDQGGFSQDLQTDIATLATRLRNAPRYAVANQFLIDLPEPLFNQAFPQLFGIFSKTAAVKGTLFERALVPHRDLFFTDSYKNALEYFFSTNNLALAKLLIVENRRHSPSLKEDTLTFVRAQKASDPAEACRFVQDELPDANFALCWNELLLEFQTDPATFNFLVNKALQSGLLTDGSFTEDLKYLFETLFGTWMTPAHRPEAINLFRLLQTSLNFYNRLNNGNLRLTTPHTTIYDDHGTQRTALHLLSVDCHGFSRFTATIQIEFALEGLPAGTRALWVHGAGTHSPGKAPVLKVVVPGLWANIQIIGSQIMGRTINAGATVVERI